MAGVTVHMNVQWDKPGVLPDWINLDMAHECVADGLVKCGIILDDAGRAYQRGTFSIERVPKGKGRTVMTVDLEVDG